MRNRMLWFFLGMVLAACAPARVTEVAAPTGQALVVSAPTRAPTLEASATQAATATMKASATPTPLPPTATATLPPSATPTPTRAASPTPTLPPTATLRAGGRFAVIGAAAVYDAKRETLLTFGGALVNALPASGGALTASEVITAETWAWLPLRGWENLKPATAPPARVDAALVYDRAREQVLLFGGYHPSQGYFKDTWAWDGIAWTELSPASAPGPRAGAVMAYDEAHQNVVLFGGVRESGGAKEYLKDTWLWDGQTWTQVEASGPRYPKMDPPGMVYDRNLGRVALWEYGTGMWIWDGKSWSGPELSEKGPSLNSKTLLTYDTLQLQMVLLEQPGMSFEYTVWTGSGASWKVWDTADAPAAARPGTLLVYHGAEQRVLLIGPRSMPNQPTTWTVSYWAPAKKAWIRLNRGP